MQRLTEAPWSRRAIIGTGLGMLAAAPGLAWAQSDPIGEPALATRGSGRNLLTIAVQLEGKGPFRFVVDTGADHSVVADTAMKALGLAPTGMVRVEGIVQTVEVPTIKIASLRAGQVERRGLQLAVLPRAQLMADGYLGLDVLNGYRLAMDFAQHEMRLIEPRSHFFVGPNSANEVPVQLTGDGGHLRASQCRIDGVPAVAFIDTGAEISVGNNRLLEVLSRRDVTYNTKQVIPLTGVTGGVVDGRVTTVRRIKFGSVNIEDSAIAVADLQVFRLWGLSQTPALLIGMNWLRLFNRVTLDYGRKELRFDLASVKNTQPLDCDRAAPGACPYLVGSPTTIPRPSVAM